MQRLLIIVTVLLLGACLNAEELDLSSADLGEIDRRLNNPLTSIWSLTFQNNTSTKVGDAVDGDEVSNTLFFQPFMPFELGPQKELKK